MCGETRGLVGRMRAKMQEEHCTDESAAHHCIILQETLCGKVPKMEHVMNTVTQTVSFIRARGLYHPQFHFFVGEIDSEFADIFNHTEVRWLGREKVLKRVFELCKEICQFMDSKGKDFTALRNAKWKCKSAFMADVTAHLTVINLQFQGRNRMITDMGDAVEDSK